MFDKLLQVLRFGCAYEAITDSTYSAGMIRGHRDESIRLGAKRSGMTDGYGVPLGRVLAGANCHDSPLLAPTPDLLNELGPLPDQITVHLGAGYAVPGTFPWRSRASRPEHRLFRVGGGVRPA